MGITEDGIKGEQKLFNFLKDKGFKFFQPDAIGFKNNVDYVFEAKHQERYTPPPFEGHGLPIWQVKARMDFQKRHNIKCILVIFEKKTNKVFYQSLEKLEETVSHDTKGSKPRRVYNLKYFKKFERSSKCQKV